MRSALNDKPTVKTDTHAKHSLAALHLLRGVAVPGVVVVLVVFLSPQTVYFPIFLEVLRPLLKNPLTNRISGAENSTNSSVCQNSQHLGKSSLSHNVG